MHAIDQFGPHDMDAFVGYSPKVAARFWEEVARVAHLLRVEVEGIENVPPGRALLVMNHAFGWDAMLPMAALRAKTGRNVWALGEHMWWRVPFLRKLAASVGTVDGTPENADRLLSAEQLVVVLPGGMREAVKPRELRYRLLWGSRYGFVRTAIRNRAPLVPLAAIGSDDVFSFVGDAVARGRRVLGTAFPIPRPAHLVPVPHLPHLRYVIGEPIVPGVPPEAEKDTTAVRKLRREVEGALQELLDVELARRAGVQLD